MKITVNQLRRIIKEEVGRIFETEETPARAERIRKGGAGGLDNLSIKDQQEYIDTFGSSAMAKLPSMMRAAVANAEKNGIPDDARELINLMNRVIAAFDKLKL